MQTLSAIAFSRRFPPLSLSQSALFLYSMEWMLQFLRKDHIQQSQFQLQISSESMLLPVLWKRKGLRLPLFYLLPKILPRTPLTMVLPIDLPIEEVMVLPVLLMIWSTTVGLDLEALSLCLCIAA